MKYLILCLALLSPCFAAKGTGPGAAATTTNTTPAPTTPKYVDPVNGYMTLYDTNHDGKLEADELKKMSILDPAAYAQAQAFANSRGELGVDELSKWRIFLKAQYDQKQQTKGSS